MGGGGDARGELEVPTFWYAIIKSAYYGTFLCLSALRRRDFDGAGPIRAQANLRGRLRSVLQPHGDQLHRVGRRAGGIFSPDFGMTAWSGRGYASDRNLKRLETNCVPEPYLLLHPHRT